MSGSEFAYPTPVVSFSTGSKESGSSNHGSEVTMARTTTASAATPTQLPRRTLNRTGTPAAEALLQRVTDTAGTSASSERIHAVDIGEARDGLEAMLSVLLDLLVGFIGEGLTTGLVQDL